MNYLVHLKANFPEKLHSYRNLLCTCKKFSKLKKYFLFIWFSKFINICDKIGVEFKVHSLKEHNRINFHQNEHTGVKYEERILLAFRRYSPKALRQQFFWRAVLFN